MNSGPASVCFDNSTRNLVKLKHLVHLQKACDTSDDLLFFLEKLKFGTFLIVRIESYL